MNGVERLFFAEAKRNVQFFLAGSSLNKWRTVTGNCGGLLWMGLLIV